MDDRIRTGFNSALCKVLLRYFSTCYRNGIVDACKCGYVDECREAVDRLRDPASYGDIANVCDWNEWQFLTVRWMRDVYGRGALMVPMMSIRRPTHNFSFLLQLAKMHYLRGVIDYVECHGWLTDGLVSTLPAMPYLLKRAHSYRLSTMVDRFEMLQQECLNLMAVHQDYDTSSEYYVPPSRLRIFVERTWSAMQRARWFDEFDVDEPFTDVTYDPEPAKQKDRRRGRPRKEKTD